MFKPVLSGMTLAITAVAALQPTHVFAQSNAVDAPSAAASAPAQTVEVTARIKRLNDARTGIHTQTGASI